MYRVSILWTVLIYFKAIKEKKKKSLKIPAISLTLKSSLWLDDTKVILLKVTIR